MNARSGFAIAALVLLLAAGAAAQPLAVEGVTSPAWLERGGARLPLAAGMRLADGDRIVTGAGARVLLRMAEGSAVKLGENASLTVDGLAEAQDAGAARVARALLDVAHGAFRLTTEFFRKKPARRDFRVRISTITIGIRGTDVWGKSEDARDIVCLIEGRIAVEHAGAQFTMAEPLSFFIAPHKDKPLPVAPVDRQQLAQWAAETEIAAGSGGARRGGRHFVNAAVVADQQAALAAYDRLRAAGYPAVVRPLRREDGSLEYRVRVEELPTRQDAGALAQRLQALGLMEAAVSR